VFGIGGRVAIDAHGHVIHIILNHADRCAHWLFVTLQTLASSADVAVSLGET
jgi:hypothetical protein